MTQTPTTINLLDADNRRSFVTVLGVIPSAREAGLAVLDLGGLAHHAVLGIRKHPTAEGREAAFRHGIRLVLEHFPAICRIAVAIPNRFQGDIALIDAERAWLRQEADERGITFAEHDLTEARRWCAGERVKPTTRELAPLLADEFPELRHALPGPKDLLQRYRFRYWAKTYSAVALAKYDLERTVTSS